MDNFLNRLSYSFLSKLIPKNLLSHSQTGLSFVSLFRLITSIKSFDACPPVVRLSIL